MIGWPAGTRIWIVAGVTGLRRGFVGLAGIVQTALAEDPFSGQAFVFGSRRGDLIKVLWWDGDGLCLFAKRLERGRFIWPQAEGGTVSLTPAQLSMLLEGIDWRCAPRPRRWRCERCRFSIAQFLSDFYFRIRIFCSREKDSGILRARSRCVRRFPISTHWIPPR
jgi:transposase